MTDKHDRYHNSFYRLTSSGSYEHHPVFADEAGAGHPGKAACLGVERRADGQGPELGADEEEAAIKDWGRVYIFHFLVGIVDAIPIEEIELERFNFFYFNAIGAVSGIKNT